MNSKIDRFQEIQEIGYICEGGFTVGKSGCGDSIFWNVVQLKEKAIEPLIDRLDDTTRSKAFVPNFGGYWTVGDISYVALQEIIHDIPTFDLLPVEFDENGCGYCAYWKHLRAGPKNRKQFQKEVRMWYRQYREKIVWVDENRFSSCDCRGEHPNGGYYLYIK